MRLENRKKMGIWDFISWSTDTVKGLLLSSYDHGSAAITNVKKVVTVDAAEKVNQHLSDPETRSKISRVATDVAKNFTIEGLKTIPGAYPTYKIVSNSVSDNKKSKNENKSKGQEEDLKTLQTTVSRLEKEVGVLREAFWHFTMFACIYPTYKIVRNSSSDNKKSKNVNKSKGLEEDLKTLQATVSRLEKEVGVLREQAAIQKQAVELKPQNTVLASEKPEDKESSLLDEGNHP